MFDSGLDTEQVFGHHGSMSRTHVRRRRSLLTLASILLLTVLVGPGGQSFQADAAVRDPLTVVVAPGDTLWAIAQRTRPDADPRLVVAAIVAANRVDPGALEPGSRVAVPEP